MAIEKPLAPVDIGPRPEEIEDTEETKIEVEVLNPEAVSVETSDGGMIIDFEEAQDNEEMKFGDNLAEAIEESDLTELASD